MAAEELKGIFPDGLAEVFDQGWKLSGGWVVCAVIAKDYCLCGHTGFEPAVGSPPSSSHPSREVATAPAPQGEPRLEIKAHFSYHQD